MALVGNGQSSAQMVDIKTACQILGVKHMMLREWFKKGAPYERRPNPRGGMKKFYCDPREIYAWVRSEQIAGNLSERYLQKRVPAEQAHQILVEVKEKLGLSLTDMAPLADVPRKTLHHMLYWETYRVKTFAYDVVTRVSLLPDWVEPRRKRGQKPTRDQVIHALSVSNGIRNRAYKYLGVEYSRLHDLIDEYDLDHMVNYKYQKRSRGGVVA